MRILLVTPLYPPDISEPAPYVKELANRLARGHSVTVLTYGHIPEAVKDVDIIAIEKSRILPVRLFQFFLALFRQARLAEVIYVQNGPSVELPVLIFTFLKKMKIFLRLGDMIPLREASVRPSLRKLLTHTIVRVQAVITHEKDTEVTTILRATPNIRSFTLPSLLPRPEILPFGPYPADALHAFEKSWDEHMTKIVSLFTHD